MKYQINKNAVVELFCDLVKINSESGQELEIAEFIIARLKGLGVAADADTYGNVIAYVPGVGSPLLLSAHMDTVKPGANVRPQVDKTKIKTDGTTILGADDKAGIAEILIAVEHLVKNKLQHRALELVFSREEEIGSIGVKNLDYKKIKAKEALVLDHTAHPGKIVLGAPYITKIDIEVVGRAAHASKPEGGINAITVASQAIAKLKIGRIDHETTSNIGVINGGLIRNGVPDKVIMAAEVRSHNKNKLDKQIAKFKSVFMATAQKNQAKVDIKLTHSAIGYSFSVTDRLIKQIEKSFIENGVQVEKAKIGGASDADIFHMHGIQAVPLGSGGQNPHSVHEMIHIKEMLDMVNFLINFVKKE